MGLIARALGFLWRRWADYNSAVAILDLFDLKTAAAAIIGGVAMIFFGATNTGWSPQAVLLAALISAACVGIIFMALRLAISRSPPPLIVDSAPRVIAKKSEPKPKPDIDARRAFFQILEKSEWRIKQLAQPPDPRTARSDWLKVRLSREIHNNLAQDRLTAWGETNLQRGTGPQRQIRPEEWEQSEILFDDINPSIPRTLAKLRSNDRVSLHGIMFSEEQIFQLFPILEADAPSIDRMPLKELLGIAEAIGWDFSDNSLNLLDMQEAVRQGGADGTLGIWGKLAKWTSEELMRQELLERIPVDHWKEHRVNLFAAREGDNFNVYSWSPTSVPVGRRGYLDLHVERSQATSWLRRDASLFRGKTKSR